MELNIPTDYKIKKPGNLPFQLNLISREYKGFNNNIEKQTYKYIQNSLDPKSKFKSYQYTKLRSKNRCAGKY